MTKTLSLCQGLISSGDYIQHHPLEPWANLCNLAMQLNVLPRGVSPYKDSLKGELTSVDVHRLARLPAFVSAASI